jgi:Tfp pilus assembly protein PilN
MAVIGARPATGIGVFGRRSRPRARLPQRAIRHAGAGRRARQISIAGFLAVIAVAAGLALFYLSQSSHVAAVGYQIDALQTQIAALEAEHQQLVREKAGATDPGKVLDRAHQLGLVQIDQRAVTFATPSTDPSH